MKRVTVVRDNCPLRSVKADSHDAFVVRLKALGHVPAQTPTDRVEIFLLSGSIVAWEDLCNGTSEGEPDHVRVVVTDAAATAAAGGVTASSAPHNKKCGYTRPGRLATCCHMLQSNGLSELDRAYDAESGMRRIFARYEVERR